MNAAAQSARERMEAFPRIVTIVPMVLLIVVGAVFLHAPWPWWKILGLFLFAAGMGLLTIARYTLGNSFSIAPEARKLVTTGVYSKIRNPVYVFGTIGIAGLFLYIPMPWLLLLLIPVIPLQIVRARAEAKVLEAAFGDEYRAWRARTWF